MFTTNIEPIGKITFHEPFNPDTFQFRHEKFAE
jgi:hypothetical protein